MHDLERMPPRTTSRDKPGRRRRTSSLFARGETMVWATGGALVLCLAMIAGLLVLVVVNGAASFWPKEVVRVKMQDGSVFMGEVADTDTFEVPTDQFAALPADKQARIKVAQDEDGEIGRTMIRTANFDVTGSHFTWVDDFDIVEQDEPAWAVVVERLEWGRFYGFPKAFVLHGERDAESPEAAWALFEKHYVTSRDRLDEISDLEDEIGELNDDLDEKRLAARAAALDEGTNSQEFKEATAEHEAFAGEIQAPLQRLGGEIAKLRAENDAHQLVFETADGEEKAIVLADIIRAYRPNTQGLGGRTGVYMSRWWEFLTGEPREANTEGGVWPAIFGTIIMTLIMTILVVPFGVLAALYLREYAKQGTLVSVVRIAVGNLAGVPSIVFGVFGLGFFCYVVGASIDQVFFPEYAPNPTFGKGGLLWASLTLALLTLPVVVVATEEALAAVPNSMREGSYACGASKWQTVRRIVLPRAAPGIMTGTILAIARGAGEVAPLMLVGAVKVAHDLPVDTSAPFVHADRSFMHLGFHIYDLGFQSPNSEAAKPMVFTTTMLLIGIVVVLNVVAIWIRGRLRRAYEA